MWSDRIAISSLPRLLVGIHAGSRVELESKHNKHQINGFAAQIATKILC